MPSIYHSMLAPPYKSSRYCPFKCFLELCIGQSSGAFDGVAADKGLGPFVQVSSAAEA